MQPTIRNRLKSKPFILSRYDKIVKFLQNPKKLSKQEYEMLVRDGRYLAHRIIYEINFGFMQKDVADKLMELLSALNKHLLDRVLKAYIDYYKLLHGECSLLSCTAPTIILEEILERSLHDIKNNIYEYAFSTSTSVKKEKK